MLFLLFIYVKLLRKYLDLQEHIDTVFHFETFSLDFGFCFRVTLFTIYLDIVALHFQLSLLIVVYCNYC